MSGQEKKRCLNCGTRLEGDYCHECGQEDFDYHTSFGHIIRHFLGDYLTFDSRLFRSLAPLVAKPGLLSREYIAGRRMRYIPPVRMYVFISLVYFLLLSASSGVFTISGIASHGGEDSAGSDAAESARKGMDAATAALDTLFAELSSELGAGRDTADSPAASRAGEAVRDALGRPSLADSSRVEAILANPGKFRRALIGNMSKMMFLLLPIFALLLKVLYRRRDNLYIDHFVFALHTHSFFFLLFATGLLAAWITGSHAGSLLEAAVIIWMVAYLYLGLRRFYGQGRLETALKCCLLLGSYLTVTAFALIGVLLIVFRMG